MNRFAAALAILPGLAVVLAAPSAWSQGSGCAGPMSPENHGRAIELCTIAIGDGETDPDELVGRGVAYAALGYVEEASADFERAIEMRPSYARAYVEFARLQYRRNANLEQALRYADRAVALAPDEAAGHDLRAHILVAMERLDTGYRSFLRALQSGGPDYVRRVQTALRALGHDPGDIDGRLGPGTRGALRDCVVGSGCRLLH